MPEFKQQEQTQRGEGPYRNFINGMKNYLERGGVRIETVLGLEERPGELSGTEGVNFLGGICQQVDDLITQEYLDKGKPLPEFKKAIEEMTGKKINTRVFEGIHDLIGPWFQEFEALKPQLSVEAQRESSTDQYPVERISKDKLVFALMLLNQEQSETIMLSSRIKRDAKKWRGILDKTKIGLRDEQRWRQIGWKGMSWRDKWKNGVPLAVASIILAVGCSLGAILGTGAVVTSEKAAQWFESGRKWMERVPGVGEKIVDKNRSDRYEKFKNKEETIIKNKTWPEGVKAENIQIYLDPKSGYNEWMAMVEFCGPQCFLDSAWTPGEGKNEVMMFLGVDEAGYRNLQEHPDQIDDQLRGEYPNQPWLAELFSIKPTSLTEQGKSDFEAWMEKYQVQSSLAVPLAALGAPIFLNRRIFEKRRLGWQHGRGYKGFKAPKFNPSFHR